MQTYQSGTGLGVWKMTPDRIANHLAQLVHVLGLRENGLAEGFRAKAAFRVFLDEKNDFRHGDTPKSVYT